MSSTSPTFLTYEGRLNRDSTWALMQGSLHFEERNEVFRSLHKITLRLDAIGIDYAVVGGIALFKHGYRRFTENIDLLVPSDAMVRIHAELIGQGYRHPNPYARFLRDEENGVRIGFQVSGPQQWARGNAAIEFPEPRSVAELVNGVRCAALSALIDIKLMSGIAGKARRGDLADVQELVKAIRIPRIFSEQLHPAVQSAFLEVWCEPEEEH